MRTEENEPAFGNRYFAHASFFGFADNRSSTDKRDCHPKEAERSEGDEGFAVAFSALYPWEKGFNVRLGGHSTATGQEASLFICLTTTKEPELLGVPTFLIER